MTLVKFNRPLINRTFEDMFSSFFDEFDRASQNGTLWRPAMNAKELDKSYELSFSLPGFKKDDMTISVKNNMLTLRAEMAEVKEDEDTRYLVREIARGTYERIIDLPENVNSDKISAEYKNGILTLTIPKVKEALPKEIAVTVK
jgi:HSP20 family protein